MRLPGVARAAMAETVEWIAVTTTTSRVSDVTKTRAEPRQVRALVAGRSSTESTTSREPAVIVGKTLYLLDTDVEPGPSDEFVVRGHRYEVEGEAHRWGDFGVEVAIKRTAARP